MFSKILIFLLLIQSAHGKEVFRLPKTFNAHFEQSYRSALKKIKKSQGIMEYQYPSKIRMEVLSPRRSRLTVLSNGKTLWKYSPSINKEKPIVNKSSASGFRFLRVFDLLQKGLKNNKNFTVKTDGLKKRVIFTENFSNEINYAEIILNFKTEKFIFSNIDYLNLIKINGRVTKLSLSKIKKNITIPKSRFNYN